MCCCCGRGGRRLSGVGCHRFESVFLLRYGLSCWIATLQTERTFSEAGKLNYLAVEYPLRCMFPFTRRFAPRWSAQTKVAKRPSPSFVNVEIYWTLSFQISYSPTRLPALIPHPPSIYDFAHETSPSGTEARAAGRHESIKKIIPARTSHLRIIESACCPLDRRNNGTARSASSPLQVGVKGQGGFQAHHGGGSPQRNFVARGPRGRGVNHGGALPRRQRHNV